MTLLSLQGVTRRFGGLVAVDAVDLARQETRLPLDAPRRPAQAAQCEYLLFLFFAQDIAHVDGG